MSRQSSASSEIAAGHRFAFGSNWRRFLDHIDDTRIQQATISMVAGLGSRDLAGVRFLDAGSGSGLFSLAARQLGADVTSFDFDPESVECTKELRRRYTDGSSWVVKEGSVLSLEFLSTLGTFDVVYSWGVLHHTGQMWAALTNVSELVAPGGFLYISVYNDQGWRSRAWRMVKRLYCRTPRGLRWMIIAPCAVLQWTKPALRDLLRGRPRASWDDYGADRGMDPLRDLIDWVGGFPFEVATPAAVHAHLEARGFVSINESLVGHRSGCNEFVFRRI